ncbi:MAG: Hsp70 family protein [Alphaproteobacteria bacterium]|nr:Hsp70 family protein [Alphaproteobacteria bacterium]
MKYVGIDLGTTNSVICSYDGENVQLYKSPEQHDVTPSVIYIDKRSNRYIGSRAYDMAAKSPNNAAILFKRVIGTSTPIKLSAVNLTMSPEECSAEILRVLYSYLPEEVRNSDVTGTVITVPAAFNQMQKDATMAAAEMAGLGRVALMQEPVAAVMSVMRQRKGDGIFIVYDLGGGTLDVAIAESISSHVNLLAHGGIAMCGGRDFDRSLLDQVVKPWLRNKFNLPEDLSNNPKYLSLLRMATWAAEKVKIELSQKENATISASETELGIEDESGNEIYIDIPLARSLYDELIAEKISESVNSVRETLEKAGLTPHDIERIVFVGGPTQYKPLRDKVASELGIASSTDVNPMTAVAEGAAVFAESIDWSSQSRGRKNARGSINTEGKPNLTFNFIARTPDSKAKIGVKITGGVTHGAEFQIDCLQTGWSSGRIALKDGAITDVSLSKQGENVFKVFVFDTDGGSLTLDNNKITITRTAAAVDAIPASSSIGIEVLEKLGGRPVLEYIVKEGEPLPKKGKINFKASESLRAGSSGSINFKIREGEINDPVTDNRFVGALAITGSDFDDNIIATGAELICEYEVLDSGNVILKVSVPSIGGTFHSAKNLYSRQSGQIDYSTATKQIKEEASKMRERLEEVSQKVSDPKLENAKEKIEKAERIEYEYQDPEEAKAAMDEVQEAKKILSQVRRDNLKPIRQLDLDRCISLFDGLRKDARPSEISTFESLAKTAQRSIDNSSPDFENLLSQLSVQFWIILNRQDWWIVHRFKYLSENDHLFMDKHIHKEMVQNGQEALRADDIDRLRNIIQLLESLRIDTSVDDDMISTTNIVRG